jgi:perosamine synthetase
MTNIAAALGLAQLEQIDELIQARARLVNWYSRRLEPLSDRVTMQEADPWTHPVLWMQTIMLRYGGAAERDSIARKLDAVGIETRPVFYPMHLLPPYKEEATLYPNAVRCASRGLSLPTHGLLTETDVDRICRELKSAIDCND